MSRVHFPLDEHTNFLTRLTRTIAHRRKICRAIIITSESIKGCGSLATGQSTYRDDKNRIARIPLCTKHLNDNLDIIRNGVT